MAKDLNALPARMRDALEDLVGEVSYARRQDDLGRLASVCYCEVRRWARIAGEDDLAELSCALVSNQPAHDRKSLIRQIDRLLCELEEVCHRAGVDAHFVVPRSQVAPLEQQAESSCARSQ
ncbi:hypothetical protein QTH87_25705 [Variovorax sp. J22P168]|uniref:hypothetical protein n=1 Tax=Variovorax jilinensis TaxID=3053513 RepID=UPI002574B3FE|nr:hypothetical protein [Variovorax sp. J22P168]MDM0015861.1 hypothetical protein [Variovorax sp. J22P168]